MTTLGEAFQSAGTEELRDDYFVASNIALTLYHIREGFEMLGDEKLESQFVDLLDAIDEKRRTLWETELQE